MEYQFCGVFLFKKKLYVNREEKVGGPRRMLMPLKELPATLDARTLGEEILSALDDYQEGGRPILAEEWEVLNRKLLDLFDEKSIAAFERKKKEVSVRRARESGKFRLCEGNGREIGDYPALDAEQLGDTVKHLLSLPG